MPHSVVTSPTQMLSQLLLQQKGSTEHIVDTQPCASQPDTSATPVWQMGWEQPPPMHGSPHTLVTSPTQMLSQLLLQQKGSTPQI
jgi:hypothetical protein